MRIDLERSIDSAEWAGLLAADPGASFYHEEAWRDGLLAAHRYFQPLYCVARDGAGRLLGALPAVCSVRAGLRQLLSLPFGTYATPLAGSPDPGERREVLRGLVRAWAREADRAGTVRAHLVLFEPGRAGQAAPAEWAAELPRSGWRRESTHLLDLSPGFETLWRRFDGDKRTSCRRAERAGIAVADETTAGGAVVLAGLYGRQCALWRDHSPMPPRLFHDLVERDAEHVRIWVARQEGRAVCAEMVFHFRGTTTTWLKCGTAESRASRAGFLLYKAVIQDACARGHRTFNWGANRGSAVLDRFKEGFGTSTLSYWSCLHEADWFRPWHRLFYRVRGLRAGA